MYTRSKVRRPSRPDSEGTKECVEEDLGSLECHCSEMSSVLFASSAALYAGGAEAGIELIRGGSGGGLPLGRSGVYWAFSDSCAGVAALARGGGGGYAVLPRRFSSSCAGVAISLKRYF